MKNQQFKPKHSFIMLEPLEARDRSEGGIIIPESYKAVLNQGKVLAIGPTVDATQFDIGEILIFPIGHEYRMTIDGKEYIFIEEANIMCGDASCNIAKDKK